MGWQLWDSAGDYAAARAGKGAGADFEPSFIRSRIAFILWLPGVVACFAMAWLTGWQALGWIGFMLFLLAMWLYVYQPRRVLDPIRKRIRRAN